VHDAARGTTARLTFERVNTNPVWTPDGKRLIYMSASAYDTGMAPPSPQSPISPGARNFRA
jgi:Tol biopolymer transport system component